MTNLNEIPNQYTIKKEDIKVGSTFYFYHNRKWEEILIGEGTVIENMYVDFPDKKRIPVHISQIYSKIPSKVAIPVSEMKHLIELFKTVITYHKQGYWEEGLYEKCETAIKEAELTGF